MKNATYTDSVISFISMMDFINFIAKQLHGQHYKSINVNLIK